MHGLDYVDIRKGQINVADTEAQKFGTAQAGVQGSLGARFTVTPKFWVDVGLMEDLRSQSAPDIVFQLLLGVRL